MRCAFPPYGYYSRVDDWRIIYEVDDADGVINISAIQHRSKVYKKL